MNDFRPSDFILIFFYRLLEYQFGVSRGGFEISTHIFEPISIRPITSAPFPAAI